MEQEKGESRAKKYRAFNDLGEVCFMTWELSGLYRGFDDPAFAGDMQALERNTAQARALLSQGGGRPAGEVLAELIRRMEELQCLSARLGNMVALTLAADANDQGALLQYDRLCQREVEMSQLLSQAARYTAGIDNLAALCKNDPLLARHEYLLRCWQREAAHTIDPALEGVVLQMRVTGGEAWSKLRDDLDAGHTVRCVLGEKEQVLTLSQVRNLAYSPDPQVRKAAYQAELAAYPAIEQPMAACLNGIKGEAITLLPLRRYPSALDQSMDQARITRPILDALIGAMEEALPTFRRYLRLKAKALGHQGGLPFWDLFAPLGQAPQPYTLDQARQLLVRVLGAFSPAMGDMIQRAFDQRWIDAYPRPGKQGGAFCSGVYPVGHSFVLANFDGTLNAVSTLAHELGHAYHDQQLFLNGPLLDEVPMPLAETASIFNETLLCHHLLDEAGPEQRALLLDQELSDATQTVVDILSRFYFEREVFARRQDHVLSPGELCQIMLEAQQRTYGDGLSCYHPYMWACKSHYYSPDLHYYNFPYAFGLLFGKGIYAMYQEEGPAFQKTYDRLLRQTALDDAAAVAATVGIDLADPAFWRGSLALLAQSVDALEKCLQCP